MDTNTSKAAPTSTNIMIVIDTDYVKACYTKPSRNPNKPTVINDNGQYMICSEASRVISGQGSANLNFIAAPGDKVSFRGISIYGNSDDAVIIYGVEHKSGTHVFSPFRTRVTEVQCAVVPDVSTPDGLPAETVVGNFVSYDSIVAKPGSENFKVHFALYTIDEEGETQNLYGYYYWCSNITVRK